jgi:hypothetical protein
LFAGDFLVTVTALDNGVTYTGSGYLHVTRPGSDWALHNNSEGVDPVTHYGLFTFFVTNHGPEQSEVRVTVTGLAAGPVIMVSQGTGPCAFAGSTLTCTSQLPSFGIQFVDRSPNWRTLRVTATAAPLNGVPDYNLANNTAVLGPFQATGGGSGGAGNGAPAAGPLPPTATPDATATATAEASPQVGDSSPSAVGSSAVPGPTPILAGASSGWTSGPTLGISGAVLVGALLGVGAVVIRRRRRADTGFTVSADEGETRDI